MNAFRVGKAVVAGALCALLLGAPAPAAARVSVTVEIVYGGVIGCGLGLFLYFGGHWESPLAERLLQGSLLEFKDGRARLGVPIPSPAPVSEIPGEEAGRDALQLDLLRWRF